MKSFFFASKLPAIICIIMLLFASIGSPMKNECLMILRVGVTLVAVFIAYSALRAKSPGWIIFSIPIAVVFNPVVEMGFSDSTWRILYLLTVAILLIFIFSLKRSERHEPRDPEEDGTLVNLCYAGGFGFFLATIIRVTAGPLGIGPVARFMNNAQADGGAIFLGFGGWLLIQLIITVVLYYPLRKDVENTCCSPKLRD